MIPENEKNNILMPNVISTGRSCDNVSDGIVMNGGLNLKDNLAYRNSNNISCSNLDGELELLMLQQQLQQQQLCNRELRIQRERGLDIFRSGSAPPTVEGALSSARSLFRNPNVEQLHDSTSSGGHGRGSIGNGVPSEEEIRSHPAYLAYYYSNENHNPRLPPPLLSKEDWLVAQRVGSSIGAVGDWRSKNVVNDHGSSSLFSMQPGLSLQKAEDELIGLRTAATSNLLKKSSPQLRDQGNLGTSGASMGLRKKSFADIVQEGGGQPAISEGSLSRPASCNSLNDNLVTSRITSEHSVELQHEAATSRLLHPGQMVKGLSGGKNIGSAPPEAFSSASRSPSIRRRTLDPHLVGKSASPGFLNADSGMGLVDGINVSGSNNLNGSGVNPIADVADSLAGLNMSKDRFHNKDSSLHSQLRMGISDAYPQDMQLLLGKSRAENLGTVTNFPDLVRENGNAPSNLNNSSLALNGQPNFPRRTYSSASLHSLTNNAGFTTPQDRNCYNSHNYHPAAGTLNGRSLRRNSGQAGGNLPQTLMDPRHVQNLHGSYNQKMNAGVLSGNPSQIRNADGLGHLQDIERLYLETLLAEQKQQCQSPLYVPSGLQHQYGNPALDVCMPYQGNKVAQPVFPAVGSRTCMRQNERMPHIASMQKHSIGNASWHSEAETNMGRLASTSLEEINNPKTRSLELSDVLGHVLEFSMDQYGSRCIQQKLENAAVEEKMKIYLEIIPHARSLMTDVFGNYVIQKFFEHGTGSQKKELASQLIGHVLPLSLQMYGCRVIQKALEMVDVEQQTQMVAELDGSVMKCVRDQNGNHVIQKCIECVPQDRIQFIISSFFGQVVALSMHPYGCRVIQRVLEHCDDPKTQNIITDEIMHSICTLVQDQYGNYVIQHVLQHGKPHERSTIIRELAGQIVKMSQQKFASNVVEKCLTFGSPEERQILVNEMLGTTDENEPLQAMMKDPFGNYVVQKVLETCNDQSREHILSRIRVHLNALKKYTYGKHIVSRVEKLITTGERHKESSY